jgi:hypothetical protein
MHRFAGRPSSYCTGGARLPQEWIANHSSRHGRAVKPATEKCGIMHLSGIVEAPIAALKPRHALDILKLKVASITGWKGLTILLIGV